MKYKRIINRPMFNPNVSAYGRGITSNLVSEEQRVKFNVGGRVGYQEGEEVHNKPEGYGESGGFGDSWIGRTLRVPLDYLAKPVANVVNPIVNTLAGTNLEQMRTPYDRWDAGIWNKTTGKFLESTGKSSYHPIYNPDADITTKDFVDRTDSMWGDDWGFENMGGGDTSEPQVVNKEGEPTKWIPEVKEEVVDEESDTIDWTDTEKREKKGQVQLALAERLIGGARDPLGSTKQQKNIAGMFGDIRKITDKEDLRKWKRKYDAAAKYEEKKYRAASTISREYDTLVGQGAEPGAALYRSSGIKSKTIPEGKGKDIKKAYKNVKSGDVIWDENQTSWYIMTPDGLVSVTKEQILESNKSGKLKELRDLGISKITKET